VYVNLKISGVYNTAPVKHLFLNSVMNTKLYNLYAQLEKQRLALLQEISRLDDEVFFHTPQASKWSVAQILTHLVTSERLSLLYMQKKALGIQHTADAGIIEQLKIIVLKISQRLLLRFKAPGVVVENTPPAFSFEEAKHHWDTVRSELKDFLEKLGDEYANRKIYKHPVAGRLSAYQALQFFQEHINHHYPQIRKYILNRK
jgi:uncharacterized damage-inducible protein DinB